MERRSHANEQYSGWECIEISRIPANVADNGLESKVLQILEENRVSGEPWKPGKPWKALKSLGGPNNPAIYRS